MLDLERGANLGRRRIERYVEIDGLDKPVGRAIVLEADGTRFFGSPTKLKVHMAMLIEQLGAEWTYAGVPSASFPDGSSSGQFGSPRMRREFAVVLSGPICATNAS